MGRIGQIRVAAALLLLVGAGLWVWVGRGVHQTWVQWIVVGSVAVMAAVPRVRRGVERGIRLLRRPTVRPAYFMALVVFVLATGYLAFNAIRSGRALVPHGHDDQEILLQARLLSVGQLWLPAHPHPDFFQTFHVFSRPVYAPIHFPGAAMMYAPWAWFDLPYVAMPLVVSGACVAVWFLVASELTDRAGGVLAALLLLSLSQFRYLSILNLTNHPALLLGLMSVFAYLRWRVTKRTGWLVVLGAAGGWLVITRPPDAAVVGVPLMVALWMDRPRAWRQWAALVLPAAPFLALHLVFNIGVTGRALLTPHQYYTRTHFAENAWGLGGTSTALPAVEPEFPEMRAYVAEFYGEGARVYRERGVVGSAGDRLRDALGAGAAHPAVLVLAPVGLLMMGRRRWVVLAFVPMFLAVYALAPVFLLSYATLAFPAIALAAVLATRALRAVNRPVATFATLATAGVAVAGLPPIDPSLDERGYGPEPFVLMELVYSRLPADLPKPALVFFRWSPAAGVHEDPVYNLAAARIDDNPLVKARDLGERNGELIRYYAERQPSREVFVFDRTVSPPRLTRLGRAGELVK